MNSLIGTDTYLGTLSQGMGTKRSTANIGNRSTTPTTAGTATATIGTRNKKRSMGSAEKKSITSKSLAGANADCQQSINPWLCRGAYQDCCQPTRFSGGVATRSQLSADIDVMSRANLHIVAGGEGGGKHRGRRRGA